MNCDYCGTEIKTRIKRTPLFIHTERQARKRNGRFIKRRVGGWVQIWTIVEEFTGCPACAKRNKAEYTQRDTYEKWRKYMIRNPIYYDYVMQGTVNLLTERSIHGRSAI